MDSGTFVSVKADVETRFRAAVPRPWAAPRSFHQEPAEEEYSRCVDPGKYVIAQQRATAWCSALTDAGIATSTKMGPRELVPWGAVESTMIAAAHAGTEPVFLHFTSEHVPGVVLAYGRPEVVLTAQPVCGCDACDDGSASLLEALDEAFESVVLGEVLIEHGERSARVVTCNGESTSSSTDPEPTWVVGRWNGAPWLD